MDAMIREIFTRQDWSQTAQYAIESTYQSLRKNKEVFQSFLSTANTYFADEQISLSSVKDNLNGYSETTGINMYTLCLLFCIYAAKHMQINYKTKKYSDEIFWKTIEDFKWKMLECREIYGIYGTFVFPWYENIFRLRCFGLGRLQFEKISCPFHFQTKDFSLCKNDPILNMHIPSSGPLTTEKCIDALKRAYAFFGYRDIMPVCCTSWLLYAPYADVFSFSPNIERFRSFFSVVENIKTETFADAWRVFGTQDPALYFGATALQKQMLRYMETHDDFGLGSGILLFDGIKIMIPYA